MAALVPDDSLLHFALPNFLLFEETEPFFIWDKCCHLTLCLQMMKPHCNLTNYQEKGGKSAAAAHLDQNSEVLQVAPVPRVEGLEQLEARRLRVDVDLDGGIVHRGGLVGVLAGVESSSRKLVTVGRFLMVKKPDHLDTKGILEDLTTWAAER